MAWYGYPESDARSTAKSEARVFGPPSDEEEEEAAAAESADAEVAVNPNPHLQKYSLYCALCSLPLRRMHTPGASRVVAHGIVLFLLLVLAHLLALLLALLLLGSG